MQGPGSSHAQPPPPHTQGVLIFSLGDMAMLSFTLGDMALEDMAFHWEGTQQCHSCDDGAVRVTNVWWIVWLSCNSSHIWLTASLPPAQCPSCAQLCQSTPRTLQTAIATSKYRHGTFFCNLLSLPSFQSFPIHQQRMSCCVFLKSQERVNLDSLRDENENMHCTSGERRKSIFWLT